MRGSRCQKQSSPAVTLERMYQPGFNWLLVVSFIVPSLAGKIKGNAAFDYAQMIMLVVH